MSHEWRREQYVISTDPGRLDRDVIHAFLASSYWAEGIPRAVVDRSIEHSLCFGMYDGPRQIGFARVITDFATFAYLADVFVVAEYRGRQLSQWLMQVITEHPSLQGLRRWVLVTRDAHGLYEKVGFSALPNPERYMERFVPDIYSG